MVPSPVATLRATIGPERLPSDWWHEVGIEGVWMPEDNIERLMLESLRLT
jgi:hypothetical protein